MRLEELLKLVINRKKDFYEEYRGVLDIFMEDLKQAFDDMRLSTELSNKGGQVIKPEPPSDASDEVAEDKPTTGGNKLVSPGNTVSPPPTTGEFNSYPM